MRIIQFFAVLLVGIAIGHFADLNNLTQEYGLVSKDAETAEHVKEGPGGEVQEAQDASPEKVAPRTGLTADGVAPYMDRIYAELDEAFRGELVGVRMLGNSVIIDMPPHASFERGQYQLNEPARSILTKTAQVILTYPRTSITIAGHADSQEVEGDAYDLTQRRAESVKNFLVGQQVLASRIKAIGYGKNMPASPNETSEGRQANRRFHIEIIPIVEEQP